MKLSLSSVVVDLDTGGVVGGSHGDLTDTERRLLAYLFAADGSIVPRADLLRDVWDAHPNVKSRMVDRAVARLRKKLRDDGTPRHILSIYGQGYRLVADRLDLPAPEPTSDEAWWGLGSPVGPCVGRSDALAQLHERGLRESQLRVCGPVGVGRHRVLRELAWRQKQRFPGGVFAIDGRRDLALQLATLPVSLGAPDRAGLEILANPDTPRLVVVRDLDHLAMPVPDLPGLHVWGTTATEGLRLAPLSGDDAVLLLRDLRRRALPHAPWGSDDPGLHALVGLAEGLPALLHAAEGLSRTLPAAGIRASLATTRPIQELLQQVLARLAPRERAAAYLLAALGGPLEPDDLPPEVPLRDAAPALVGAGLLAPGRSWALSPLLRTALRGLDPDPVGTDAAAVDRLVDAVIVVEARAHERHQSPKQLARLGQALLATEGLGSDPDRTALALEAAATLLGRQNLALARLADAALGEAGRQARGRMNVFVGRHEEGFADLQGPPLRPDSAVAASRVASMRGDLEGAKATLRAGERLPGPPWLRDQHGIARARVHAYEGEWPQAMALLHDVIERCQDRGDGWTEAQAVAALGHIQGASGDAVNGGVNLERAHEQLRAYGDRRNARLCALVAGQLALNADDLVRAAERFEGLCDEAQLDHHDDHLRIGATMLGLTRLCQDDLEGARRALSHVEVDEAHAFRRVERHVRAWLLALSGQSDQAAHALGRALRSQPERPQAPARGLAYLLLAHGGHAAAPMALERVRHDVTHGDEEHASLLHALEIEDLRNVAGTWSRLAVRWRRRAARRGWAASAWALQSLAAAVQDDPTPG